MINVQMDIDLHGIHLRTKSLEVIERYFDDMHMAFAQGCALVHRKSVFEILIRVIQLCNVQTGRLRGSFTPFMDAHGFRGYDAFMQLPSLDGDTDHGQFNERAVNEGRSLGNFIDSILSTTISTNVVYAPLVDQRSNFLVKALAWGDERYNANFQSFFDAAYRAGWIPTVNPNDVRGN